MTAGPAERTAVSPGESGSPGWDLATSTLHASLEDPALESMNFLNEVGGRYPDAISFASGRPTEQFFDLALLHQYIDTYARYLRETAGFSEEQVGRALFQYGRTNGIVHDLIARQLETDEGISADPESIVVTVGCQEAMFLVIRALRADERDVLLAVSPTYVGLTGAARLADMPVRPVRSGRDGVDFDDLIGQVRRARDAGLRPRGLYVMPDFANPSGMSLSVPQRRRLLEIAAEQDILLLEDNPYGTFHDGTALPTLKALDTERRVVYLGSFAKTAFPAARVGYAVADQRVIGADGAVALFADHLSKIKSMVTVNTSPVTQAVVAGKLLANDYSLIKANEREAGIYRQNRRQLLAGLAARFPAPPDEGEPEPGSGPVPGAVSGAGVVPAGDQAPGMTPSAAVTWNSPAGGFFVVVSLPVPADDALLEYSARQHGVLWTPMCHFYDGPGGLYQARLACSQVSPAEIETGLDRFAALLADVTSRQPAS